jgi:protocatechuate 3,4-dioxygenase beta subunit
MARFMVFGFILLAYFERVSAQEPVIGGPCQGCELVFVDMPAKLKSSARIAPLEEKGEPLVLNGKVYKVDGTPATGIIVYAYQTDANGSYPKGSTQHGKLRGWAITDQKGLYRFETIRPSAYPGRKIPQHIHLHIIEPNKATYYIDDVTFDDDPLLTDEHQQKHNCRGGCGESHPKRNNNGDWHVRRDITLGEKIPKYK